MTKAIEIFERKLIQSGLAGADDIRIGFLDAELEWNAEDNACRDLEKLFQQLNINSLVFCRPSEPYRTMIDFLADTSGKFIQPQDCESRTFLHDIPIVRRFCAEDIAEALSRRKGVIIPGRGVVTSGTVSIEQAFVTFSSVCFACYVKFLSDYLRKIQHGRLNRSWQEVFFRAQGLMEPFRSWNDVLIKGPFTSEDDILSSILEVGRLTVENRLVDSYFGNVSYCNGRVLYISQTGASLDDLKGCVDPCPLDESSCAAITASSELTAHLRIIDETRCRAILHGHPKFSVILSMDCDDVSCPHRGQCHIRCPRERRVCGVPVVSGEVGTGPYGLCRTVPKAIKNENGVIVYGHGVFTIGNDDFNEAFRRLQSIENACREEYFRRIRRA